MFTFLSSNRFPAALVPTPLAVLLHHGDRRPDAAVRPRPLLHRRRARLLGDHADMVDVPHHGQQPRVPERRRREKQLPPQHVVDVPLPLLRGQRRPAAPQGIQLPVAEAAHPLPAGLPDAREAAAEEVRGRRGGCRPRRRRSRVSHWRPILGTGQSAAMISARRLAGKARLIAPARAGLWPHMKD